MADAAASQEKLPAGLTRMQLREMFHALVLARVAEERLGILFEPQGDSSGHRSASWGREAGAVGAAYALRRRDDGTGDMFAQTSGSTGAMFLMGGSPTDYFRQHRARATTPAVGREAQVHWVDYARGLLGPVSPLGIMVEVMAGVTLSFKLRGQDRVGVVFCGEGVSSTGAWHEGLNFAAALRCPMLLLIEASGCVDVTSTSTHTRVESFTEKAEGYGLHAVSVDGTDVLAVYESVMNATTVIRAGGGVGMVELCYPCRGDHGPHLARERGGAGAGCVTQAKDPILMFRNRLIDGGWAMDKELDALHAGVVEEVGIAAEQAMSEPPPDGVTAAADVYTDLQMSPPWTRAVDPDPRRSTGSESTL